MSEYNSSIVSQSCFSGCRVIANSWCQWCFKSEARDWEWKDHRNPMYQGCVRFLHNEEFIQAPMNPRVVLYQIKASRKHSRNHSRINDVIIWRSLKLISDTNTSFNIFGLEFPRADLIINLCKFASPIYPTGMTYFIQISGFVSSLRKLSQTSARLFNERAPRNRTYVLPLRNKRRSLPSTSFSSSVTRGRPV